MGVARDSYPRDGSSYSFVAGFAEVEVDVETGNYLMLDYLAVADVGTVIHPQFTRRTDPRTLGARHGPLAGPEDGLRPALRCAVGEAFLPEPPADRFSTSRRLKA